MTKSNQVAKWIVQVATKIVSDDPRDPRNDTALYLESSGSGSLCLTTHTDLAMYGTFEKLNEVAKDFGCGAKPVPVNELGEVLVKIGGEWLPLRG